MGEVAEMMLDGTLCEGCGVFLNENSPGHPCHCHACAAENQAEKKTQRISAHHKQQAAQKKVPCPTCGRRVKAAGLADHIRDSHAVNQPALSPHQAPATPDPHEQYKPAFEAWAAADGTYHLAPAKWRVVSIGGVPYDGYVRPYLQDRTVHTFQGFMAGFEAGRADLVAALHEIARHESSEGHIALRALQAVGAA